MRQTCPQGYAPQCAVAPHLPAVDTRPAGCRSIPAKTAGAQTLPVGRSPRILPLAGSSFLLRCSGPRQIGGLLVNPRIAIDVRFKLYIGLVDGLGMAQKQISARLQIFIKPLDQLRPP